MQFDWLKRREFITLLGGAAAWPLAARAQQERMRLVCILEGISADTPGYKARHAAFLEGLQQLGWTPGRNVRIEVRWGEGDETAIRKHAAELVALVPDVLVAGGGSQAEVARSPTPFPSRLSSAATVWGLASSRAYRSRAPTPPAL